MKKKIFYAEASYSDEEISEVTKVLKESRLALMDGPKVKELETSVAKIFNKKYGLMVNSGSSANLIGILSLKLPKGSKVITPALTFSTTVSPLVQSGLIPYFIDVDRNTLQLNTDILKRINLENVSAICVPNLIGNVANWEEIYNFAKENHLKIIEDSADTIGYSYKSSISNWSDISTTSFYASHVITGAGFGGMTCFSNKENFDIALSLRGWGRRSSLYSNSEDYERRFNVKIDDMYYDDKYIFDDVAYNFLPSEISAAFALVQLKKLNLNIEKRIKNFTYLKNNLNDSDNFYIPRTYSNVKTGWLAFPLLLQKKLANKRKEMQIFLEKEGIQTRTIFTGNIIRQPVSKKFEWDSFGSFEVSDEVMKSGILLGSHNRQPKENLDFLIMKIKEAEKKLINL
ncbi:MAG: NarL family transcriptional regulator [Flavobacteriaceae bacterium]|nr:NarL family transcriptional regulator [Flavobacteriaceae bacterium]